MADFRWTTIYRWIDQLDSLLVDIASRESRERMAKDLTPVPELPNYIMLGVSDPIVLLERCVRLREDIPLAVGERLLEDHRRRVKKGKRGRPSHGRTPEQRADDIACALAVELVLEHGKLAYGKVSQTAAATRVGEIECFRHTRQAVIAAWRRARKRESAEWLDSLRLVPRKRLRVLGTRRKNGVVRRDPIS